jgi:hypothetical protein
MNKARTHPPQYLLGWLLGLAVLLGGAAAAAARSPAEDERIAYLISSVAAMSDAQFLRNGTHYDARAAAEHLRMKLGLAGSHVQSAEDFIRYCATSSSVSGRPYQIRLADGQIVPAAEFLRTKLAQFDRDQAARAH